MNAHERFLQLLARRAELSPREETALDDHLRGCAACRETAADYARQSALLRALPVVDPPAALRQGVLRSLNEPRPAPWWRRVGAAVVMAPLGGALAAAVIALAVLHHSPSGSPVAGGHATIAPTSVPLTGVQATPHRTSAPRPSHPHPHTHTRTPVRSHHAAPGASRALTTPVAPTAVISQPPLLAQGEVPTPTPLPALPTAPAATAPRVPVAHRTSSPSRAVVALGRPTPSPARTVPPSPPQPTKAAHPVPTAAAPVAPVAPVAPPISGTPNPLPVATPAFGVPSLTPGLPAAPVNPPPATATPVATPAPTWPAAPAPVIGIGSILPPSPTPTPTPAPSPSPTAP